MTDTEKLLHELVVRTGALKPLSRHFHRERRRLVWLYASKIENLPKGESKGESPWNVVAE